MSDKPAAPHKSLIVQKYGGSSLARPEQIQAVADRILELKDKGHALLIVVSAMGKTTDQLVELAYQVSPAPNRRELDMLLTTGERVSMALMSMALNDRACRAISFTGSQAGLFTDTQHSAARIMDVRPQRVEQELAKGHVVVLAGFQGVSPVTKEVTTLGRGGSDTTAVAMAAYFRAERCEIRKDVDGVHSADPNAITGTEHLAELHFHSLLDMTFWGAKVLHYRSVELAALLDIPVMIGLAHGEGRNTMIHGDVPMYEQARILSVNTHKEVRWIQVAKPDFAEAMSELSKALRENHLPLPQWLDSEKRERSYAFLVTAPAETLTAIDHLSSRYESIQLLPEELSSVSATCQGAFASPLPEQMTTSLQQHGIRLHKMIFGAMSLTVLIDSHDREKALQLIHNLKFESVV